MTKYTKIRKWAEANGYKTRDAKYVKSMLYVDIGEDLKFTCESRESTIYYSIRGIAGNRGGLYMSYEYTPKNGKRISAINWWHASQNSMIAEMEQTIERIKNMERSNHEVI